MDFIETEEQSMIREMVRGFAEKHWHPRAWNGESSEHLWRSGWNFATLQDSGSNNSRRIRWKPCGLISESIIVEEPGKLILVLSNVLRPRRTVFNDDRPAWE